MPVSLQVIAHRAFTKARPGTPFLEAAATNIVFYPLGDLLGVARLELALLGGRSALLLRRHPFPAGRGGHAQLGLRLEEAGSQAA